MRKFIIKNRQKRKYVRRQDSASALPLPDLALIGLTPLILIAIAFVITTWRLNSEIAAINYPVDLSTKANDLFDTIPQIVLSITSFISQTSVAAYSAVVKANAFVFNVAIQMFSPISSAAQQITEAVINYVTSAFGLLEKLAYGVVSRIASFYEQIIRSIVLFWDSITEGISATGKMIIKTIRSPFVEMNNYSQETLPFQNSIGSSFNNALDDLVSSFKDILKFSNDIAKASSKASSSKIDIFLSIML